MGRPTTSSGKNRDKVEVQYTKVPDVYGQVHPIETPELIECKLEEFNTLLEKKKNDAVKIAEERCPHLLTNDFKLMFLRSDIFIVPLSVRRYNRYWEQRRDIFGDDMAYDSLTLKALDIDDALEKKFIYLAPKPHPSGRQIIVVRPAAIEGEYDRTMMARAAWYVGHAAMESELCQKYGMLVMFNFNEATLSQYDRKLYKKALNSMQGALPMRNSATHLCYSPSVLKYVMPFINLILIERIRKRLKFHYGDNTDELHKSLIDKYGLTKDCIPKEFGGNVDICIDSWLKQRRQEGK